MILVKATKDSEAGTLPAESEFAEMGKYHEALQAAGMLLDASGLKPTNRGWRIRYDGKQRSFVEGPFTETKDLVAGYTIIQAKSREEAIEWTKRFPNPAAGGGRCEIEVRPLYELEDFAGSTEVERFRALEAEIKAARQ
jgi:hypothetical protein